MIIINTNLIIRFIVRDIEEQAKEAEEILLRQQAFIPEVVFPEIDYVLRKQYGYPKEELCTLLDSLIKAKNLKTPATTPTALKIYSSHSLDLADCFVIAHALKKGELATFDKKMMSVYKEYLTQST